MLQWKSGLVLWYPYRNNLCWGAVHKVVYVIIYRLFSLLCHSSEWRKSCSFVSTIWDLKNPICSLFVVIQHDTTFFFIYFFILLTVVDDRRRIWSGRWCGCLSKLEVSGKDRSNSNNRNFVSFLMQEINHGKSIAIFSSSFF